MTLPDDVTRWPAGARYLYEERAGIIQDSGQPAWHAEACARREVQLLYRDDAFARREEGLDQAPGAGVG